MRGERESELSDRLGALEGWPVPRDPEPVVWAEPEDDDAGFAAPAGEEGARAAERS
jgi:hypothetical protein